MLLPEAASDPAAAWREQGAVFHHLGFTEGVHASDWVPLWCGAVPAGSPAAAAAVESLARSGLVLPGGIATSLAYSGHQWDFPNAWCGPVSSAYLLPKPKIDCVVWAK
jgi:alpha,alpha-trehalase